MKTNSKNLLYLILSFLFLILTGVSAFFHELGLTIFFSLFSLFSTILLCKSSIIRVNSITFFFLLFYILYTYSGVLTVFYDVDTRLLFTSSTPEAASSFIFSSTLGLFGFSIPFLFLTRIKKIDKKEFYHKQKMFSIYALLFMGIATLGEFLNIFRAGGLSLLALGKAGYQSKTADLFITFPSALFLQVGFFFLGLRMFLKYETNFKKAPRNKILLLSLILGLPIIFIYLSIGFRSPLLAIAIAFIMGFSYFIEVKSISRKVTLTIFIGYSILAILFGIRGQLKLLFATGDWDAFKQYTFEEKAYLKYYNPANNEFGISYMNYATYYNDDDKVKLLYGSSYLEGFLIVIPRAILPFEKPLPISFRFRDRYFSGYKKHGRIAGTGFSSIIEPQWNFGLLGPFFVFFVIGCGLWVLEYYRNRYRYLFIFPVFYAMLVPLAQSFHRSSSGYYISYTIILFLFLFLLFFFKRSLLHFSNPFLKNQ